jgi:hypothetical protein
MNNPYTCGDALWQIFRIAIMWTLIYYTWIYAELYAAT